MVTQSDNYYTDGTTRCVCIQGGNPDTIGEGDYFSEL